MKFTLKTKESTVSILGGIAGLVGFNLFYFTLALPPTEIAQPIIFWTSFCAWGLLGLVLSLRVGNDRRKMQDAFLIFAIIMIVMLGLAAIDASNFASMVLSFPGFPAGIAVWSALILLKRAFSKIDGL
ncbi:MAG: hypothetical protein M1587_07915 [Thaumarchaeota archaeon]|nr:hypothetical protein [Nitrososphaerota archaeon]